MECVCVCVCLHFFKTVFNKLASQRRDMYLHSFTCMFMVFLLTLIYSMSDFTLIKLQFNKQTSIELAHLPTDSSQQMCDPLLTAVNAVANWVFPLKLCHTDSMYCA